MLKLMDLNIHPRQPATVKEALLKYCATCMQFDVAASEEAVCLLADLAEKCPENAHMFIDEAILKGTEDLEDSGTETLEMFHPKPTNHTLAKEHTDRQKVVLWGGLL